MAFKVVVGSHANDCSVEWFGHKAGSFFKEMHIHVVGGQNTTIDAVMYLDGEKELVKRDANGEPEMASVTFYACSKEEAELLKSLKEAK